MPGSAPTTVEGRLAPTPGSAATQAAFAGLRRVPEPVNDPNRGYLPGSPERAELKARLMCFLKPLPSLLAFAEGVCGSRTVRHHVCAQRHARTAHAQVGAIC